MFRATFLAAALLAAPLLADAPASQEDMDARAALALHSVGKHEIATVSRVEPGLSYLDAVAWTHLTHRPVIVSVRMDCKSLCSKVRGEIPATHVQTLVGDPTPRLCLVCADAGGQLWKSGQCWDHVPSEAAVKAAAADLVAKINPAAKPPNRDTRAQPAGCICGDGQCKCEDGNCPGGCPTQPGYTIQSSNYTKSGASYTPLQTNYSATLNSCPNGNCQQRRGLFR